MRFVDTLQTKLGNAALRRVLGGTALSALLLTGAGSALGQIKTPRYQSPLDAPVPQPLVLPTPPAITPNGTVVEDVIVRVNDQVIDRSDIERGQGEMLDEAQRQKLTSIELAERQKDMLRDMIDTQLLISRAKELDINPDAEVIRQLDSIRKQNKLDSMEALEKAVRDSGINYEDWKANIRNSIMTQQVVRDEVGRNLRMSPKEEQAYYEKHKADYEQPEQVKLSEILIPTPDNATDAQVAQALAKTNDIIAKYNAGAKFEDLAKQYSGGSTADKGGDLGAPYKLGAMGAVYDDQTFKLPTGGITNPIRTKQGYVVLKVTDHIQPGVPPLKDVEDQVQEAMYREAMAPALRTYLTGLRINAYIYIAPGFVDTGSSPKETQPVFSAATPPPVKKKVIQQKQRLTPARAAAPAPDAASTAPGATAKTVSAASGKKRKKVRREKVRFGQGPQNSLPAGPDETATVPADQNAVGPASGVLPEQIAVSAADSSANVASNDDPLAPVAPVRSKTRYSDRAATEGATKAAAKAAKVHQKVVDTPTPMTQEEKMAQQVQNAPLGLRGDTASKKKKKRAKDAPKERLQDKAPAPPAPKPDATPLPPKSVRDNGESPVNPTPDLSKVPPQPTGPDTPPPTPANPSPQP